MAHVMQLLNASDTLLLDISEYVGGKGDPNPTFGSAPRDASRSETFLRSGQTVGHTHDSIREIIVPIVLMTGVAGVGTTQEDLEEAWFILNQTLDIAAGLKVILDGLSVGVIYTLLRDFNNRGTSTGERIFDALALRQGVLFGQLRIEAQPYTRNASLPAFIGIETS
jgi:hypothetical protein